MIERVEGRPVTKVLGVREPLPENMKRVGVDLRIANDLAGYCEVESAYTGAEGQDSMATVRRLSAIAPGPDDRSALRSGGLGSPSR